MPWLSRQNDDWLKPDIAQLRVDGNPRLDLLSLEPGRSNRVPTELAIYGELVLAHVNNAGQVLYFNHPDAVRADDDDVAFDLPRPAIDRDRQVRVKLKFVRELVPKPAKNPPFAFIDWTVIAGRKNDFCHVVSPPRSAKAPPSAGVAPLAVSGANRTAGEDRSR